MSNIMLYYDRIDVSEGNDANGISVSKQCDICHYWYFLTIDLPIQHGGSKRPPDQFFPCNFYKRRN